MGRAAAGFLREANRRHAGEALWFNVHNYLQSGCISNIFLVEKGKLVTPPTQQELRDPVVGRMVPYPKSNVLPGVTRAVVLDLARREGIDIETGPVDVGRLLEANEVHVASPDAITS